MAAQEAETDFNFYLRFAKPLVLNLTEPNERALAAAWIQKLRDENVASEELRTNYLKLLLFVLQRQKLIGPFSENPNEYDTLENLPTSNLHDVARELLELEEEHRKQKMEKGKAGPSGDFPPYITEYSADLLEYSAAQDIPNFGVHAYYAISNEPLTSWDRINTGVFPRGLPTIMDKFESTLEPPKKDAPKEKTESPSKKSPTPRKKKPLKLPSVQLSSGEPPPEEEREPPNWGSNLIGVTDPPTSPLSQLFPSASAFMDESPPSFFEMETPPSLELSSNIVDTIDKDIHTFNKITENLADSFNASPYVKTPPPKRTDMSTSYDSMASPYQRTPKKLYSPQLPRGYASPFFMESPPNFVDDDNLPSPEQFNGSFASPYQQTPSPRRRLSFNMETTPSPHIRTPSPRRRLRFGADATPSPYRRTPSPRKRLSFGDFSTPSPYKGTPEKLYSPPPDFIDDGELPTLSDTSRDSLPTPKLNADDVFVELDNELSAWERTIAHLEAEYEEQAATLELPVVELTHVPQGSEAARDIVNSANAQLAEETTAPVSRLRQPQSRLPTFQSISQSGTRTRPQPSSSQTRLLQGTSGSRLRQPRPRLQVRTEEQSTGSPRRRAPSPVEEQMELSLSPQRRTPPPIIIVPSGDEQISTSPRSPGWDFEEMERRFLDESTSPPRYPQQGPIPGAVSQALRTGKIVTEQLDQLRSPSPSNDEEEQQQIPQPTLRQIPRPPSKAGPSKMQRSSRVPSQLPQKSAPRIQIPQPSSSASIRRMQTSAQPRRQIQPPSASMSSAGPSRAPQPRPSRIAGRRQLPQPSRPPSPRTQAKMAKYEEYKKRYQYRHPGTPRTPPLFSRFRSLMGAEGRRKYQPSEFGEGLEDTEWKPAESFFINRTALSPRVDERERRYRPFSDILAEESPEDNFLMEEMPELVDLDDDEDILLINERPPIEVDEFSRMSREKRSPTETPQETFKKIQGVAKDAKELKDSIPAEAGVPLTTPRPPPSPIRGATKGIISESGEFIWETDEKEQVRTVAKEPVKMTMGSSSPIRGVAKGRIGEDGEFIWDSDEPTSTTVKSPVRTTRRLGPISPVRGATKRRISDSGEFIWDSPERPTKNEPKVDYLQWESPPRRIRRPPSQVDRILRGTLKDEREDYIGLTDEPLFEELFSPPPVLTREEEMLQIQATLGSILQGRNADDMTFEEEAPFDEIFSPPPLSPRPSRFEMDPISAAQGAADEIDLLDEENFPDIFNLSPEIPTTPPGRRALSPFSSPESPEALAQRIYQAEEPPYLRQQNMYVTVGKTRARQKRIPRKARIKKMSQIKEVTEDDQGQWVMDVSSASSRLPHQRYRRIRRSPKVEMVHEYPIEVPDFMPYAPPEDLMGEHGIMDWETSYTAIDDSLDTSGLPSPMQPDVSYSMFGISPPKKRIHRVVFPHEGHDFAITPSMRDILYYEPPVDLNLSPPPMSPTSLQAERQQYKTPPRRRKPQTPPRDFLDDIEEPEFAPRTPSPSRRSPTSPNSPESPYSNIIRNFSYQPLYGVETPNREKMPLHVGNTRSRMRVVKRKSARPTLTSFREDLEYVGTDDMPFYSRVEAASKKWQRGKGIHCRIMSKPPKVDSIAEHPYDVHRETHLAYPEDLMGKFAFNDYDETSFTEIDKSFEEDRLPLPIRPHSPTTPTRRHRRRKQPIVLPEPGATVSLEPRMRDVLSYEYPPEYMNLSPPQLEDWELPTGPGRYRLFEEMESQAMPIDNTNYLDVEDVPEFFDDVELKTPPRTLPNRPPLSPSPEPAPIMAIGFYLDKPPPYKSKDYMNVQVGRSKSRTKSIRYRDKPTLKKMPTVREVSDAINPEDELFMYEVDKAPGRLPSRRRQQIRRSPKMEILREYPVIVPDENLNMPLPENLIDVPSVVEYDEESFTELDKMFSKEGLPSPMRPERTEESRFGISPPRTRTRKRHVPEFTFPHEGQDVRIDKSLRDVLSYEPEVDLPYSPPPLSPRSLNAERESYYFRTMPQEYKDLPSNFLEFEEFQDESELRPETPPRYPRRPLTPDSPESPYSNIIKTFSSLPLSDVETPNRERMPLHVGTTRSRRRVIERKGAVPTLTSFREDLEHIETDDMPFYSRVEAASKKWKKGTGVHCKIMSKPPKVDSIAEHPLDVPNLRTTVSHPEDMFGKMGFVDYEEPSAMIFETPYSRQGLQAPMEPSRPDRAGFPLSPPRTPRRTHSKKTTVALFPPEGVPIRIKTSQRDIMELEPQIDMNFSPPHLSPASLARERESYMPQPPSQSLQQEFSDISQDMDYEFAQSFGALPTDAYSYLDEEEVPDMFDVTPPRDAYFSPGSSPESPAALKRRLDREEMLEYDNEPTVVTVGKTAARRKLIRRKSRKPKLQKIEEIDIYEEQTPSETSLIERREASIAQIDRPVNLFGESGYSDWEESVTELDKTPPRGLAPPMMPTEQIVPEYMRMYLPSPPRRGRTMPVTLPDLAQEVRLRPSQRDIIYYEFEPEYYSPPPASPVKTPPRSAAVLYEEEPDEYYSPPRLSRGRFSSPHTPRQSPPSPKPKRKPFKKVMIEEDIWDDFPQTLPFANQPENPFESLDTSLIDEDLDSSFIEEGASGWKWLD